MRRAVFPGSFDPITIGHESIIKRSLNLFDEIVVAIGVNTTKKYLFPLEKRKAWLETMFKETRNVRVDTYTGLTIDYCKKINANFILRGLRTNADFEFEKAIAQMNHAMNTEIETVMIVCEPRFSAINSTIVREIYVNKGDISSFIPKGLIIE